MAKWNPPSSPLATATRSERNTLPRLIEEHVMSDTFVMSARQAAELDHAFERNGWTSAEVKRLSSGNILTDFRKVLMGHAVIILVVLTFMILSVRPTAAQIDLDADPFIPSGLTVVEHQKGGQFTWDASKVTLYVSKQQQGGTVIEGKQQSPRGAERPQPIQRHCSTTCSSIHTSFPRSGRASTSSSGEPSTATRLAA
jgi:hypothetical protein